MTMMHVNGGVSRSMFRLRRIVQRLLMGIAVLGAAAVQGQTNQTAELQLTQFELYPYYLTNSLPISNMTVDMNPPFLFCAPQGVSKNGTLYYFRLSQDDTFTSGVITNTPHRWSFYSPYTTLAQGVWYWQYAYQPTGSVGSALSWSATQNFTILPNAWTNPARPVAVLESALISNGLPRAVCRSSDVGNLMPQDATLRASLSNTVYAVLAKTPPTVIASDYENAVFISTYMNPALVGYALTADARFKNYATNAYAILVTNHATRTFGEFEENSFRKAAGNYYELFSSLLTPAEVATIREWGIQDLSHQAEARMNLLEREPVNEHDWQSDVGALVPMALTYYDPADARARDALGYLYDLWNFRGPVAGRTDGSWRPDGYFNAHIRTLLPVPALLSQYTGADLLGVPWYRNVAKMLAYSSQPTYPHGAYGDGGEGWQFVYLYDVIKTLNVMRPGNPWNHRVWRMGDDKPTDIDFIANDLIAMKLVWYALPWLHNQPLPSKADPIMTITNKAEVFRDAGLAVLCTDPNDQTNMVRVLFRACPMGVYGHAHAGQNGFNITYGNQPVFYKTGYYSSSGDAFSLQDYKHTRGHNTILPYGNVCQGLDTSGYGWMARFVNGNKIGYALGDASSSYSGSYRYHEGNLRANGIPITLEAGFGKPGVTRFRRHLALLDTGTVVIYDELEATNAIPWTFQLNSIPPAVKINEHTVASASKNGIAVAELFCDSPVSTKLTDQFSGSYKTLYNNIVVLGKGYEPANHWHASITPTNALQKTRFLTLIHRVQNGQPVIQSVESVSADGRRVVSAGGWNVEAELDTGKPSFLKIWNNDNTAALVSGQAATSLQLGSTTYTPQLPGSTILLEQGRAAQEAVDVLPDMMRYGNIY